MANELTGDFDVVFQFAVSAVNRILAAMHQLERFPHSISGRFFGQISPPLGVLGGVFGDIDFTLILPG